MCEMAIEITYLYYIFIFIYTQLLFNMIIYNY